MTAKTLSPPMITLTTDFGLEDAYVGSMKGIILSINPQVRLIDITHELPAHSILGAAIQLREACPRFPPGTVHVAVIDPGVGGPRRPVLLAIEERYYVGPDNGIFGLLVEDLPLTGAWKIENQDYFLRSVSRTFHGRDVFAPVAAHLSAGVDPEAFGPFITDPASLSLPPHRVIAGELRGQILWIDHFGNCVTNLDDQVVSGWAQGAPFVIHAASKTIVGVSLSYESIPEGEALAIFNSLGYLEIACNQARGDQTLGITVGDPVALTRAVTLDSSEGNT